jgi:hypothetical protein
MPETKRAWQMTPRTVVLFVVLRRASQCNTIATQIMLLLRLDSQIIRARVSSGLRMTAAGLPFIATQIIPENDSSWTPMSPTWNERSKNRRSGATEELQMWVVWLG